MFKIEFEAKMVRVYCCQAHKWEGRPLHEAILSACLEIGLDGATVYRGIEGFGVSAHIQRSSMWPSSNDPPIMVSIVGRDNKIARLLPRLDEMVAEGIVAISKAEIVRYSESLPQSH
jgi:hypothetical protein